MAYSHIISTLVQFQSGSDTGTPTIRNLT